MARYIDADKIHEFVDAKVAEGKDGWAKGVPYEWAYALTVIDMQPAANVVPKSEVENLKVLLEIKEIAYEGLRELYHTDTDALVEARRKTEVEVAREIFELIDCAFSPVLVYNGYTIKEYLKELKKKYMEGEG